jgi:outer membrane protein assembly factor BamB
VYALDARTGVQKWNFTAKQVVQTSPVVTGDTVIIGSDDANVRLLCFKGSTTSAR